MLSAFGVVLPFSFLEKLPYENKFKCAKLSEHARTVLGAFLRVEKGGVGIPLLTFVHVDSCEVDSPEAPPCSQ